MVTTHVVDTGAGGCYALAGVVADATAPGPWRELGGAAAVVVGPGGRPEVWGAARWTEPALAAARERLAGRGRAVVFPGWERLRGMVTVAQAVADSALDEVHLLGGASGAIDEVTTLVTHDFVRPVLDNGRLILSVTPLGDGSVEPFERRRPHQCCTDG